MDNYPYMTLDELVECALHAEFLCDRQGAVGELRWRVEHPDVPRGRPDASQEEERT